MQLPIFINWLLQSYRDVREDWKGWSLVYLCAEHNGKIFEYSDYANENGEIISSISSDFEGAHLTIRIRHRWYKNIETTIKINGYGIFHTAKIFHDFAYWSWSPSKDPEWLTEKEYSLAEVKKNGKLRDFRFKNILSKIFYWILFFGWPMLGYYFWWVLGILLWLVPSIVMELISPYSTGIKKLF